uniref:Ig-like domain-containing protein n=1 Tax=Castor canadensis TaxID=51338 RepID=A0A8C0X8M6_CASCN
MGPLLLAILWVGEWTQDIRSKELGQDSHDLARGCSNKKPTHELEVQRSVLVQEGLCLYLSCNIAKPSTWTVPVYGYWFQKDADTNHDPPVATNKPAKPVQKGTQGRFRFLGDLSNNCSLSIRDVRKDDNGSYFFRVEAGDFKWNYCNKPAPRQTLEPGHPTKVTCSASWACEQGTPPIFSWMSAALTSPGPKTALSSMLTLTPRPQDHGTNLTCQVTFPGADVTVKKTIQLNVSYAPQNLIISVSWGNSTGSAALSSGSSLHIQEGESLRLVCVPDSNPPATLKWTKKGQTLRTSQPSNNGVLELPWVELEDQGKYVCHAQNLLGTQTASVSLIVHNVLKLLGPSCSWGAEGLHCSCSSRAWPPPSLRWRRGEVLLEGISSNTSFTVTSSSAGPWVNSSLNIHRGLSTDLRITCEAQSNHGTQSGTALVSFPRVKTCRKKSRQKAALKPGRSVLTPFSPPLQDHLNASESHSTPSHPPPVGEQPEAHYASLSFPTPKSTRPQAQVSNTTEYSEIKIHN